MAKKENLSSTQRLQHDIETMATFIDASQEGWTRRAFSASYAQGRTWLKTQMLELGMEVSYDAAANLIGVIKGECPKLPSIMVGSHTDTVAGGGRFDGIIGVLAGLEIVRIFKETGTVLQHTLEVVDFTAEEPTEFGVSTVGSRGMINGLTREMLERKAGDGYSLQEQLKIAGGEPQQLALQARKTGDIALYLELHIEQGPILEETSNQLGIVTGIVGIHRYCVTVDGTTNHAGTTPMNGRYDALTAACQMIVGLETICKKDYNQSVVGTVGKLHVVPNAANVIPGRVIFELEVRCIKVSVLEEILVQFRQVITEFSRSRSVAVRIENLSKSAGIKMEKKIIEVIQQACTSLGNSKRISSGAGHDANHLALIAPIGMIFIPSVAGRSHCPEEWSSYENVALGTKALVHSITAFDKIL